MWTIGLNLAAQEGEILGPAKKLSARIFGDYWNSPILGCPYCMPSVHGLFISLIYHLYYGFPLQWYWYAVQWLFIVSSSSFLNYILFNLIRILKGYAALFDEQASCSEVKEIEAKLTDHE